MGGVCPSDSPDCSTWPDSCGLIRADPDIAGIGVVLSFGLTCALTLIAAFLGIFLRLLPNIDQHPVDRAVLSVLKDFLYMNAEKRQFWTKILRRIVLGLSDQQLVLGLALLIVGFAKTCGITVYHFEIISDLAWFAFNTHLTMVNLLRTYLKQHPALRLLRLIGVSLTWVLLLAITVLEGQSDWWEGFSCPTVCAWQRLPGGVGGSPEHWMIFEIVLLVIAYTSFINLLLDGPQKLRAQVRLWIDANMDRVQQRQISLDERAKSARSTFQEHPNMLLQLSRYLMRIAWEQKCLKLVIRLAKGCESLLKIVGMINDSFVLNLLLDLGWFGFGAWALYEDRSEGQSLIDPTFGSENEWEFGQMIPMFVIVLPFLTAFETIIGKHRLSPSPLTADADYGHRRNGRGEVENH